MDHIVPELVVGRIKRQIGVIASLATKERIPEAAAVALALILALALWLGTRYVAQADLVRHTLEVESKISKIWSHLQDAEIGQRSYVLTGDERFLGPFVGTEPAGRRRTRCADTAGLGQPGAGRGDQRGAPLIAQRLTIASRTVDLRRQGNFEMARAVVLEGRGHALMQDLRERFQRMLEAEDELLKARTAAADTTISLLSVALVLAVAMTGAALAYWIIDARRSARELALTNSALQASIAERDTPSSRCGRCRRWRRSASSPAASRTISTTCWPSSSARINLMQRRLARGETDIARVRRQRTRWRAARRAI